MTQKQITIAKKQTKESKKNLVKVFISLAIVRKRATTISVINA